MSRLVRGARAMSIMGEVNQDDKSLQADITKLVHICECVADEFEDFVKAIFISPANIIQSPLSMLDKVKIFVSIDPSVDMEPSDVTIEDLLHFYVKDEYPELGDYELEVSYKSPEVGSMLCLYSSDRLKRLDEIQFTDKELIMLSSLLEDTRIMVAVPTIWDEYKCKHFILYIASSDIHFEIIDSLYDFEQKYGIRVSESTEEDVYTATPVIGLERLPYNIPYKILGKKDLDLQRIDTILKENDKKSHI